MRTYLLVAVAWFAAGCGGGKPAAVDLKVSGGPSGEVAGPIRITLAFSRPMVARDQLDKPVAAPPVALDPALPAEARWADEKTLVLSPKADLPVSTRFVATVPRGTRALDGNELGEPYTLAFSTPRISASLSLLGAASRASRTPGVRVSFTQDVPLAQVLARCRFTAGGDRVAAKNGPESPSGPARSYTIVPEAELALDTAWKVECDADLRGSVGNLGTAAATEESFRTYGPLAWKKLDPSGDAVVPDEGVRLAIQFTNPLKPPYKMTLAPAVPGFPERCYVLDDESPGVSCAATLEPQTQYTLTIDGAQRDAFDQALGKPVVVTFRTTDARPAVSVESGYFIAELKRPVLPVWTRNVAALEVTALAVTPANFHALRPRLDWWENKPADFAKSGLSPVTKKLAVTGPRNKWGQHPVSAAELLGGTSGPGMFYVEIGSSEVSEPPFVDGGRQKVLVNFTDIGVVSKLSGAQGLVWATRLSTGKPLPGAAVQVRDGKGQVTWSGRTGDDGVAVLPGSAALLGAQPSAPELDAAGEHYDEEREGNLGALRIFVIDGEDVTMVNPSSSNGLAAWNYNVAVDSDPAPVKLRGFMHTDRGLYRAGEKVHVKGLARATRLGSPLEVPAEGKRVKVTVDDPKGRTFLETEATLSAFGGFWFDVDLPGDARLGDYVIRARLDSGTFTRSFLVEAYRPATFEVTGKLTSPRVVQQGQVHGAVAASYFYGAPVRDAKLAVAVHARPRRVEFSGYDGYDFLDGRRYDGYRDDSEHSQTLVTELHAQTDGKGNAPLSFAVGPNELAYDADLLISASVTAPSNEVIAKSFTVPYFHARTYYGIKTAGYFADVGKPATVEVVAVGADGKPASGRAKVTISRRDWNCVWEDWGYRGNYQCKDTSTPVLTSDVTLAGRAPAQVAFTPATGGDYWIVVEGGGATAPAATQLYAWGDGGGSWRSSDSLALELVADKKEYRAGDTATLLLKTDLAEATGLVTIERDGVLEQRLIRVTPKLKHVTVPITAAHAPNVYVSVALVQGRIGDGPRGKPRMRMGLINLPVRPVDPSLTVAVQTDRPSYRPGEPVTATVKVTDAAGEPVSAEVSITASDEGVLSLIGYETPNPIPTFYASWGLGVATATQLEYLRDIPGANQERPALGGDALGTLRSRFVSTAVWAPGAVTDERGVATVTFNAPDNLTAFRLMALAADRGHRFGAADKRFTVAKPLQLHPALPRFLQVGDVVQAGVVVHNETGRAGTATVKLALDGHLRAGAGGLSRAVAVGKDARVPVLFELTAAELGAASLRFSVTMDGEADALAQTLPVRHPSPVRVVEVGAGVAARGGALSVPVPADALPGSAEVVISVDRDGLSGLEDGLRDLIHYPYGCLEQTTSQVIPMLAVRDLAETLAVDGLTGPALERFVTAGLTKIGLHQTAYGGFSLWPGGEPETYYTAYALWALHLAKAAGYRVDQSRIDEALEYLRNDSTSQSSSRPHYSELGSQGDQAFALYVRAALGDKTTHDAATRLSTATALPIYGKAFLARALAMGLGAKDPVVRKLVDELAAAANAATKTNSLIREPGERDLWAYLSSAPRTTALVLAALVELDPKNAAVKPLVSTLMSHRHSDRYSDTQSNLYALLALSAYARTAAGKPASITVASAGKPVLTGALTGKQRLRVATLPVTGPVELGFTPTGEVHYRVAVRYRQAPKALVAEGKGLTLTREYLDEAGQPKTSFVVGDVVRVRLTAELPDDVDQLMISDALPAGFEALNTRLATVGASGVAQTREWGSYRELRDERVDYASSYASRGRYVREYQLRAIAAGRFTRPPAVAELMYRAASRAQTALDVVEIKAR